MEEQEIDLSAKRYIQRDMYSNWYIISELVFSYNDVYYEIVGKKDFLEVLALYTNQNKKVDISPLFLLKISNDNKCKISCIK